MEQTQPTGVSKEQEMFSLIAEHEASDLSVKEFCELYDMAHGTYYYWQKKYHASRWKPPTGSGFTLLKVADEDADPPEEGLFAEYKGVRFYREPSASHLLKASTGLNLALHYLSGSVSFDPATTIVDPVTASKIDL